MLKELILTIFLMGVIIVIITVIGILMTIYLALLVIAFFGLFVIHKLAVHGGKPR